MFAETAIVDQCLLIVCHTRKTQTAIFSFHLQQMEVCCVRFPFAANKLKLPFSISSLFQMCIVLLPRGRFQEIKCMMTTHGLFLNCAKKFCLHIYTKHNQLLGLTPFCENDKGNLTYLEGRRSTHSGEPHPLWSLACQQLPTLYFLIPPHPLLSPSAHIMLQ